MASLFSTEERALLEGTWPLELLEDPIRQPRVVTSAREFLWEVFVGEHLGDFIVLPNGVNLLGLTEEDSIPSDVLQALDNTSSVKELLQRLQNDSEMLGRYKAGLEYVDRKGEQRMVLPKQRRNLPGRISEILRLVEQGEADPESLYIAEMRLLKEAIHPVNGEKVKTVCKRDVKDVVGHLASWTFYWDRHDEGVFIGNRGSGKGVHVDQVLWSNVGKNWRGHKLVAAWPKGAVSNRICTEFDDQLFSPPLSDAKAAALREAAKVALLRPGDVYFFSGGTAHTALCISRGMGLSAYESIVTLHPLHSGLCMQTCDRSSPCWLEGAMPDDEFEDILEEASDQLKEAAQQFLQGGPQIEVTSTSKEAQKLKAFDPPQLWKDLRAELLADQAFVRLLQEHFSATVAMCLTRSRYMRSHMDCTVKRAHRMLTSGRARFASVSPERSRSRSRGGKSARSESRSNESHNTSGCSN